MKIGITTSVIQRGQTGIAQYVFALVRALTANANGHQFVLFVLEEDLALFEADREHVEFYPVPEKFREPWKDIVWHQHHLPKIAARLGLDVLHVPSYRRMLWSSPCPRVATIHDLGAYRVEGKYDWKRTLYARRVVPYVARRQDHIIAVSHTTAEDILKYLRVSPERLAVIHNGLDHDRFTPGDPVAAKELARERYGLTQPFFFYLSRLEHPAKNHVRLIAAFNHFKSRTNTNWQLVLAGSNWHRAEVIHSAIRESDYAADIHCLGFLPPEELTTLYRAADVFVFPSLYEGFGFPTLEAMACGCPVISSGRGALREIAGKAALVVEPEDTLALARQMTRLARELKLRLKMRAQGLEQARRFAWETTARATLQVYEQAARRSARGSAWGVCPAVWRSKPTTGAAADTVA